MAADPPLVRMTVNVPADVRDAVKIAAVEADRDMGDLVAEWIEPHIAEQLERVRARRERSARDDPPPGRRHRREA